MTAPGVLFVCVANSARSQIAEGLARRRFGDRLRIASAGSRPTEVDPRAIATMNTVGVDLTTYRAKRVEEIDPAGIELVVALCTEEVCPAFGPRARRLHWPMPDPTIEIAGEPHYMPQHRFRVARLQIEARLDIIEPALAMPPRTVVAAGRPEDRAEVEALLTTSQLPLEGLEQTELVIARIDGELVGTAGLERWEGFGLVRSVAVAEGHRGSGIAATLVTDRLCAARFDALHAAYLLTTGAQRYFERFGFAAIDRSTLPHALSPSTQLDLPACSTAIAMRLQLADTSGTDALLDREIVKELADHGTLVPPWKKHPEIPRYSIGWRMGPGEWYMWMWARWWEGMHEDARSAYRAHWRPELPEAWTGWFDADDGDEE